MCDLFFFILLLILFLMPIQEFFFNMLLETKSSVQQLLCQIVFAGLCPLQQSFYSQQAWGAKWPSLYDASNEVDS